MDFWVDELINGHFNNVEFRLRGLTFGRNVESVQRMCMNNYLDSPKFRQKVGPLRRNLMLEYSKIEFEILILATW